jgi:hypothetical protein
MKGGMNNPYYSKSDMDKEGFGRVFNLIINWRPLGVASRHLFLQHVQFIFPLLWMNEPLFVGRIRT